jgi:gamma-glutamyltranspeptidase / glutathione hydrolase
MAAGGNAVDAAIAANAVLGVVLPTTCGPGGDLFALVHGPGFDSPVALNASGRAGRGADAAAARAAGHDTMPLRTPWSVTVPGCVDGWEALVERFGSRSLADLLAPATALAGEGFPVSLELASDLERIRDLVRDQASAAPLYPDDRAPLPGAVLRRPDLAATLQAVGEGGRDAFYGGAVGRAITAVTDGLIDAADLATTQADWTDPLGLDLFGRRAWTIPPNSQGYLTLAAAWLFEYLAPDPDPGDAAYHHALIEAYRAVAWERDHLVADPDHAPLSPAELVDRDRLARRAERIDPGTTVTWPATGDPPGGTAYLCVLDGAGMGISLIQSNFHGIGSGLAAGDTGVFLHNRGAGFTLEDGHPNQMAPGKRPLHTLSPTLWTADGRLDTLLGTRGGKHQPQLLVQMAAHLFHAGLSPAAAQAVPRWTVDDFGPATTSAIRIESRAPAGVTDGLMDRGHRVATGRPWEAGWGPVSVITGIAGSRAAAADPRVASASVTRA